MKKLKKLKECLLYIKDGPRTDRQTNRLTCMGDYMGPLWKKQGPKLWTVFEIFKDGQRTDKQTNERTDRGD